MLRGWVGWGCTELREWALCSSCKQNTVHRREGGVSAAGKTPAGRVTSETRFQWKPHTTKFKVQTFQIHKSQEHSRFHAAAAVPRRGFIIWFPLVEVFWSQATSRSENLIHRLSLSQCILSIRRCQHFSFRFVSFCTAEEIR